MSNITLVYIKMRTLELEIYYVNILLVCYSVNIAILGPYINILWSWWTWLWWDIQSLCAL